MALGRAESTISTQEQPAEECSAGPEAVGSGDGGAICFHPSGTCTGLNRTGPPHSGPSGCSPGRLCFYRQHARNTDT